MFVAAIVYPEVAVSCLIVNLTGRMMYSLGYKWYGARYRVPGAVVMILSNFIGILAMLGSLLNLT